MALRIWKFPVAREFPEPREIPVTREFPRLKLFPPVSRETGISREFPARGFPLNITAARGTGGQIGGNPAGSKPTCSICSSLGVAATHRTEWCYANPQAKVFDPAMLNKRLS